MQERSYRCLDGARARVRSCVRGWPVCACVRVCVCVCASPVRHVTLPVEQRHDDGAERGQAERVALPRTLGAAAQVDQVQPTPAPGH